MTKAVLLVFGCVATVFVAGCSDSLREPKQPAFVVADDSFPPPPPEPPPVDPPRLSQDDLTRERALRVMATEQRAALNELDTEARFVRASSHMRDRVRSATFQTSRELASIEQEIAQLENDDSLDVLTRRERHDEIKAHLRRVATRVSLMQTALRGD